MNDLLNQIASIEADADRELGKIKSGEDLKLFRARFIGKSGAVTKLLKMLGTLPPPERPAAGKKINELKDNVLNKISEAEGGLMSAEVGNVLQEKIDVTLPGRVSAWPGRTHPLNQTLKKIEDIFTGLGFSIYEGPEVETDYYNFQALNMPKDHPARDMQDTFYINPPSPPFSKGGKGGLGCDLLLRTHTSPVQIHVMEKLKPPVRMIFPGAVYRRDADVTHSPMFNQVEGLMVDKGIRMSDLKGVLTEFVREMFGERLGVRFRPSFFPFTEPSAELDMQCVACGGKKSSPPCRLCKDTGWMEILGCGMVDPNVFDAVGYNHKKVSGFAFGMGVERIAMLKLGISDIRMFYENDVRFLKQF